MRKIAVFLSIIAFSAGFVLLAGCGGKGQKVSGVADEESQIMDEARAAARESLPTTYLVDDGETLHSIAARPEIYGNKFQWPLIYDANRDILDDYRHIEEGQKLIIPRNVTAMEIQAAIDRAKQLNWPVSAKAKVEIEEDYYDVAGIEEGDYAGTKRKDAADDYYASSVEMDRYMSPTPIPEPARAKQKKGGPNIILLLLLILAGAGALMYFIFVKQKKKEEEESEEKEDSPNILG